MTLIVRLPEARRIACIILIHHFGIIVIELTRTHESSELVAWKQNSTQQTFHINVTPRTKLERRNHDFLCLQTAAPVGNANKIFNLQFELWNYYFALSAAM